MQVALLFRRWPSSGYQPSLTEVTPDVWLGRFSARSQTAGDCRAMPTTNDPPYPLYLHYPLDPLYPPTIATSVPNRFTKIETIDKIVWYANHF